VLFTSLSGQYDKVDSDSDYYYVIGTSGMVIVDQNTNIERGYLPFSGGFNAVWAKASSAVYLGADSGMYRFIKPPTLSGQDVSSYLGLHRTTPELNSNEVLAIDGLDNNNIIVGTSSGVTYFKDNSVFKDNSYYPVSSVKLLEEGPTLYYGGSFGIASIEAPTSDWTSSDIDYLLTDSSTPGLHSNEVTDIDAIKASGIRLVAISTNSGVTIVEHLDGSTINTSSVIRLTAGG
jgi:hypothetical protein